MCLWLAANCIAMDEKKEVGEPIGGTLLLRRARKPSLIKEDYDVRWNGRVVGRIFKPGAGVPKDRPWMWTITGAPVTPPHGFCATLDEAKAKFAETWRAWLASR
jgi:hypothetical protein